MIVELRDCVTHFLEFPSQVSMNSPAINCAHESVTDLESCNSPDFRKAMKSLEFLSRNDFSDSPIASARAPSVFLLSRAVKYR